MTTLLSRKDAKASGERYYFTGKPCKHGHLTKRFTHNGACYDCVQSATSKWYKKNREDEQWQKERMYRSKKNHALRAGVEFDLDFEELDWPTHCPVLGIKLEFGGKSTKDKGNSFSFDRIDNNKGYIKGNVAIISSKANSLKSNATVQDLENVIRYIKERTN